jgi:hypothetical protein
MGFRGIVTKTEGQQIMESAQLYRRKLPIKAVRLESRTSIESRTGVIETGYPGDYLCQDVTRPQDLWIIKKEVFESEFERVES